MALVSAVSGQINLTSWRNLMAANGAYYIASTPTPGTGVLCGTVTAFSATADGFLTIANTDSVGGRTIQLDQIILQLSTPGTAITVMKMAAFNENGIVAPSGGNAAVTARNSLSTGAAPGATVNAFLNGMMTIPAAVSTRTLTANWSIPTQLGITGDQYTIAFGVDPVEASFPNAARSTAAANIVVAVPPVSIAPQNTCIIDAWFPNLATNGQTFEYFIGFTQS